MNTKVRQSGKKRRREEDDVDHNSVSKKRKLNAADLASSTLNAKLRTDSGTNIKYATKPANVSPPDHDVISDRDIEIGCEISELIWNQECLAYMERLGHLERLEEDGACEGAINSVLECDCQCFDSCSCYGMDVSAYFSEYVVYLKIKTNMWGEEYWGINKRLAQKVEQGQIISFNKNDNDINESLEMIGLGNSRCDICHKRYKQCVCDDYKATFILMG